MLEVTYMSCFEEYMNITVDYLSNHIYRTTIIYIIFLATCDAFFYNGIEHPDLCSKSYSKLLQSRTQNERSLKCRDYGYPISIRHI